MLMRIRIWILIWTPDCGRGFRCRYVVVDMDADMDVDADVDAETNTGRRVWTRNQIQISIIDADPYLDTRAQIGMQRLTRIQIWTFG